ncbi:hypothetical protein ACFLQS_00165 [Actinomycetota bacterium]
MGRLALIIRQKLPMVIFLIAAVIGGILIFWFINNKEVSNDDLEISETLENISDNEDPDTEIFRGNDYSGHYGQLLTSSIPYGLRAVSLPISFFGEVSSIREGDRVDIISVFYDPISNELNSEIVLHEEEIVIFENNGMDQDLGEYQDTADSGYFSEGIFSGISSGNNNSSQLKKIIVLTFYLEAIEVEEALRAIESGQLYLSLCPADNEGHRY